MVTYTVEIKNLSELQARFKQAPEITAKYVLAAGDKSLQTLQQNAKTLAPKDTLRLQNSILPSPMRRSGNTITGSVGTDVKYSVYQELGTGIYGPKKTKIQRVSKNGKVRYSKGVKARFYMKGSVERSQATVDRYFETAANNITRDLAA